MKMMVYDSSSNWRKKEQHTHTHKKDPHTSCPHETNRGQNIPSIQWIISFSVYDSAERRLKSEELPFQALPPSSTKVLSELIRITFKMPHCCRRRRRRHRFLVDRSSLLSPLSICVKSKQYEIILGHCQGRDAVLCEGVASHRRVNGSHCVGVRRKMDACNHRQMGIDYLYHKPSDVSRFASLPHWG